MIFNFINKIPKHHICIFTNNFIKNTTPFIPYIKKDIYYNGFLLPIIDNYYDFNIYDINIKLSDSNECRKLNYIFNDKCDIIGLQLMNNYLLQYELNMLLFSLKKETTDDIYKS